MKEQRMRPVKTSVTHPLQISSVTFPGGGKIGMCMCPGKHQPHAITGPWQRDLGADIAAIKAFGAELVVTLMEEKELREADIQPSAMNTAAREAGLAWLHLPIPDFQAPTDHFEALWSEKRKDILSLLASGKNVVLHCRGGRGRSGMIAARLLLEGGLSAVDAVARVRAVNPLAMETSAQEAYIRELGK